MNDWRSASACFSFAAIVAGSAWRNRDSTIIGAPGAGAAPAVVAGAAAPAVAGTDAGLFAGGLLASTPTAASAAAATSGATVGSLVGSPSVPRGLRERFGL